MPVPACSADGGLPDLREVLPEQATLREPVETVLRLPLLPGTRPFPTQPLLPSDPVTDPMRSKPRPCAPGVPAEAGPQAEPGLLPVEASTEDHQVPAAAQGGHRADAPSLQPTVPWLTRCSTQGSGWTHPPLDSCSSLQAAVLQVLRPPAPQERQEAVSPGPSAGFPERQEAACSPEWGQEGGGARSIPAELSCPWPVVPAVCQPTAGVGSQQAGIPHSMSWGLSTGSRPASVGVSAPCV